MLPKAHLTSYSKMSDARWVITPLGSLSHWDNFEEFFCVFLSTLLNIFCFCYVLTVSVLYCAHFCMKCSLGISNFLEEISCFPLFICIVHLKRLSCLSLLFFETLHSYEYNLSFSPLPFTSLLYSALCKASSDNYFAFLHLFFWGMVLITTSCTMSRTSVHSSPGTLSIRSNPLNLFLTSTV